MLKFDMQKEKMAVEKKLVRPPTWPTALALEGYYVQQAGIRNHNHNPLPPSQCGTADPVWWEESSGVIYVHIVSHGSE